MKRITKTIAMFSLGVLALTGCTTNVNEPNQQEKPEEIQEVAPEKKKFDLNQSFYAQTPYGSEITVDFGAEDPVDIEKYRTSTNAPETSYAKVNLDNRNNTDGVAVYKVVVFDEEGKSYEFDDAMNHISEWGPTTDWESEEYQSILPDGTVITEEQRSVLDDMLMSLQDTYLNATNASVHETTEGYIAHAGIEIPEEIVAIEVWPGGIIEDPIYMVPQGEEDSYEVAKDSGEKPAEQTDAEAEKEYNEWVADGSDCSDEVLAELGQKTVVAVAFECAFAEEAETSPAPAVEPSGQAIGPPPGQAHDVGTVQDEKYTYDEAYAAWQNGESYYSAFCVNYVPVTEGGVSQCEGIEAGTVDSATGEYIG